MVVLIFYVALVMTIKKLIYNILKKKKNLEWFYSGKICE